MIILRDSKVAKNQDTTNMVSLTTIFGGLTVLLTYFVFKHQTLKTSGELQEEIESRLQPKYEIAEPLNSQVLPHTDWPRGEFYFEVWHVEVYETRWMKWKKWLPWGEFRGSTVVKYKIHGQEAPSQDQLHKHHLAAQPYVRSISKDVNDPHKIKVIYESVNPSNISLFVNQFKYLVRDTTFYHHNPDADLQYEFIRDNEGELYARIYDAGMSEERENEGA
jgi:hypothetical protein